MTHSTRNRREQKEARKIQRDEGIKYTEALRRVRAEAERREIEALDKPLTEDEEENQA